MKGYQGAARSASSYGTGIARAAADWLDYGEAAKWSATRKQGSHAAALWAGPSRAGAGNAAFTLSPTAMLLSGGQAAC